MEIYRLFIMNQDQIPTMVSQCVRDKLSEYVKKIQAKNIVEVGAWVGACTVAILKGLNNGKINVYSNFTTSQSEYKKALNQGLDLKEISVEQAFDKYIKVWIKSGVEVIKYKGDITNAVWNNEIINLYVDDAAKKKRTFDHMINTFFPFFKKGTIIFLMDYFFYEKKGKHLNEYKYQKMYMEMNYNKFKFIERPDCTSVAIFEVIK